MKTGAAVITGAGSGIGRATAMAYTKMGVPVAVVDHNADHAAETVDIIRRTTDVPAISYNCNVSVDIEVNEAFFSAIERFGSIQFAFNNAGVEGEQCSFENITDETWEGVLNTKLRGVWLCMNYQLFHMAKTGRGSIVNCASIAGLVGFEKMASLEYAKKNIRVNAICRTRLHHVTVASRSSSAALISEGLGVGDKVVLFPSDRITDGTKIKPRSVR